MGESPITFGPRILKTGFAVMLSLYVCALLDLEPAVFAGVAAILAVQPSIYRSWKQMLDQISANVIGASISLFFIYFFGDNPITIGFVIMIVISLCMKLKMEGAIPLTLITVLAIMSAHGAEDLYFALERFFIIFIGTSSAILVNFIVLPPKYKKNYLEKVELTFEKMSLLVRTAISNEMTETAFQEQSKAFKKDMEKLKEQMNLLDEERIKIGKVGQVHNRELVVFKQMLKVLKEGERLLDTIEDHYFQTRSSKEENELFDRELEQLIKWNEYLLLKYRGKVKVNQDELVQRSLAETDLFFEQVLERYQEDKKQKFRLIIIASTAVDYAFQLQRLDQIMNYYLKEDE